jgi:hypothetical protein
MIKQAFSQYTVSADASSDAKACADELDRELNVRRRVYDRWVAEGKMTWQEGHDRMTRFLGAIKMLLSMPAD